MATRTVSYAQNGEDVVLARAFGSRSDGLYVDVGANEPTHDSVTRLFYDRGWRGINIEPQVDCIERLRAERPRDVNLNLGVGSSAATLDFYVVPDAAAMSTFSAEQAAKVRELGYTTEKMSIGVQRLDTVLAEHVGERTIDFLKVDVEGLEQDVLGDVDWTRWRPRVVVVESFPEVDAWEQRMLDAGYRRTLWDGINLFFVRAEDDAEIGGLLQSPATIVLDRFDPWLYVQQLDRVREGVEPLIRFYLRTELSARGVDGPELEELSSALAATVAARPDLIDAFGAPPETDVASLLRWAGALRPGADEPHTATLTPFAARCAAVADVPPTRGAEGRPGPTAGALAEDAVRLGRRYAGRARTRLRQRRP